jgi:hypothetical protein
MNNHKNKHIRAAVNYALERGWRLEVRGPHAHAWGVLYCPLRSREGCQKAVYGTPRIPEAHAKDIRRAVDGCTHSSGERL